MEIWTGSLGHGVPMAVGVALALRAKGSDHHVFVLLGDGEANEGSVWESLLAAGSLGLGNLTAILIDNHTSTPELGDLVGEVRGIRMGGAERAQQRSRGPRLPRSCSRAGSTRRRDRRLAAGMVVKNGTPRPSTAGETMRQRFGAVVDELTDADERLFVLLADISSDYFRGAASGTPSGLSASESWSRPS